MPQQMWSPMSKKYRHAAQWVHSGNILFFKTQNVIGAAPGFPVPLFFACDFHGQCGESGLRFIALKNYQK
jgi:hypothetical protein